ncbi:DNA primase [Panacibacter ginsenosidivorans]|uniref:DNA primase n=2 Tax=Panacibacter ginsenosidivorans TaxID=1813871 RepID=A0A5B8VI18_9BACT|nr:DNA primase [Panacibacter ginsenosidivorans]
MQTIVTHSNVLNALLNELKPIDFRERANLSDGEKLKKQHNVIMTIEEILAVAKKNNWSLCMNHGQVYIYNGQFWKQLFKEELNNFLGTAAEILGVNYYEAKYHTYKADLSKQFISTGYLPRPEKKADEVLINLKNGTFVITPHGYHIRDFAENDFLTYQLPFEYNPEATAEMFQRYLDKVLPDKNQQDILAEFIGYIFIGQQTLKLEKSLILYGTGANGKSVFFIIIQALLGNENVSNFSLQTLTNDTGYQRAKLENKLVNYASEISPRMDSTVFKQLVSGEPVEARLPYGDPFTLDNYAKLIFNTNELPKDVEQNDAFFRRFLILNFVVTIPENERDPELAKKITDNELPGVFNWMLAGLTRLLKQKKFTKSDAVDEMVNQYRIQSDSVQLFLQDDNYEKSDLEFSMTLLYDHYKAYCADSGYKSCSKRKFGERLRNLNYEIVKKNYGMAVKIKKNYI